MNLKQLSKEEKLARVLMGAISVRITNAGEGYSQLDYTCPTCGVHMSYHTLHGKLPKSVQCVDCGYSHWAIESE